MKAPQGSAAGPRDLRLRELTGHDELAVDRTDSSTAIALIDRLCEDPRGGSGPREPLPAHGSPAPPSALQLTVFERDRLLALIYSRSYGERIDSTLKCTACSKPFDISFSLQDLACHSAPAAVSAVGDGSFRMQGGVRFRLPTGEDEVSVQHLSGPEALRELLRRCVMEAPAELDVAAVQDAMEAVAPVLDIDINTTCPECGVAARVRFDLQSYLLQSIAQDRRRLWRETHVLATSYKWSLQEILGLPREDRRTLVSLIEGNAARGRFS